MIQNCCDRGFITNKDGSVAVCQVHRVSLHSPPPNNVVELPRNVSAITDFAPLFTWRSFIASKESSLDPVTRHVALTLSLHMNEKGGSCFPSYETLAEETGLSRSSVIRHISKLITSGLLVKRRSGEGRGAHNVYSAILPS